MIVTECKVAPINCSELFAISPACVAMVGKFVFYPIKRILQRRNGRASLCDNTWGELGNSIPAEDNREQKDGGKQFMKKHEMSSKVIAGDVITGECDLVRFLENSGYRVSRAYPKWDMYANKFDQFGAQGVGARGYGGFGKSIRSRIRWL